MNTARAWAWPEDEVPAVATIAAAQVAANDTTYDSLGRPRLTSQFLTDGTYTSLPVYDSFGRVISQEHQRNTNPKKIFASRYNAWGYLSQLQRSNLVLWQIRQQDARGQATDTRYGNGLTQLRDYDKKANRLKSV